MHFLLYFIFLCPIPILCFVGLLQNKLLAVTILFPSLLWGTQKLILVSLLGQKMRDIISKRIWGIFVLKGKSSYSVVMVLLGHSSWKRKNCFRSINTEQLEELVGRRKAWKLDTDMLKRFAIPVCSAFIPRLMGKAPHTR